MNIPYQNYDHIEISDRVDSYLNNQPIEDSSLLKKAESYFEKHEDGYCTCPYCQNLMTIYDKEHLINPLNPNEESFGTINYYGKFWICKNCLFWQYTSYRDYPQSYMGEWYRNLAISKIKEFNDLQPDECNQEFASYIRRNPSFWNTVDPIKLEKLVRDIFKANYEDCEVIHVGKPNDKGIDVLFIDTDKKQWLIQVKRRSKKKAVEGFQTITNVLGAIYLQDNIFDGIIVSTADHFSYHAEIAAKKASSKGMKIKLIDKGKLNRMLDPFLKKEPWFDYLAEQDIKEYWDGIDPYTRYY